MKIYAECYTKLSDALMEWSSVEWPKYFAAVPRVGDMVQSLDGNHHLVVMAVIHCQTKTISSWSCNGMMSQEVKHEPKLRIRLGNKGGTAL